MSTSSARQKRHEHRLSPDQQAAWKEWLEHLARTTSGLCRAPAGQVTRTTETTPSTQEAASDKYAFEGETWLAERRTA